MWSLAILCCTLGYLFGSFPAGYFAGRLAGVDVRKEGSGNIGATNVLRVLGKKWGYPVFSIDAFKGFAAVRVAFFLVRFWPDAKPYVEYFAILTAIASIVGHTCPVWLRFKGGKGVATSAGALLALTPVATLIGIAIWIIVFWLTRYVSLASITAAVVLPIVILVVSSQDQNKRKPLVYSSACVAAVVIWRHRSNLSRLMRGTEPRFTRK